MFLLLLLSAVQVLYGLYATSMVTAAAHDAARDVAAFDSSQDRCARSVDAGRRLRESLGDYSRRARLALLWTCRDPDVVRVRVTATHPSVLPDAIGGLSPLARVDRTIEVRVEEPR